MSLIIPKKGSLVSFHNDADATVFMFISVDRHDNDFVCIQDFDGTLITKPSAPMSNEMYDINIRVLKSSYSANSLAFSVHIIASYSVGRQKWSREYVLHDDDAAALLYQFSPRQSVSATTSTVATFDAYHHGFLIPVYAISIVTLLSRAGELLSMPAVVVGDTMYCPALDVIDA